MSDPNKKRPIDYFLDGVRAVGWAWVTLCDKVRKAFGR